MAAKIAQEVSNGKAVLCGAQARDGHFAANGRAPQISTDEFAIDRFQPAIMLRQRGSERWSIKSIARRMPAWTAIRRLAR